MKNIMELCLNSNDSLLDTHFNSNRDFSYKQREFVDYCILILTLKIWKLLNKSIQLTAVLLFILNNNGEEV